MRRHHDHALHGVGPRMDQRNGGAVRMTYQDRIFDLQFLENFREKKQSLLVHEIHADPRLGEDVGVAVAVAIVDQRAAAGRARDLRGEVAPLPDRAQALMEEDERRILAQDPVHLERMAAGGNMGHESRLACSMRATAWLVLLATLLL